MLVLAMQFSRGSRLSETGDVRMPVASEARATGAVIAREGERDKALPQNGTENDVTAGDLR